MHHHTDRLGDLAGHDVRLLSRKAEGPARPDHALATPLPGWMSVVIETLRGLVNGGMRAVSGLR